MAQELGKIHKPEAEKFKKGRKIYMVPLMYEGPDLPEEYKEKCGQYWQQVTTHLTNLESKVGRIKKAYHETIILEGEEGLKILDNMNPASAALVREKCKAGADFIAIESKDLAEENTDWERCLYLGFITSKVAGVISENYMESARKRYEFISARIGETLGENEASVLFIREGHMVQFPRDIEVFNIAPPALDEIHRWLRDQASRKPEEPDSSSSSQ